MDAKPTSQYKFDVDAAISSGQPGSRRNLLHAEGTIGSVYFQRLFRETQIPKIAPKGRLWQP